MRDSHRYQYKSSLHDPLLAFATYILYRYSIYRMYAYIKPISEAKEHHP